MLEPRVGCKDTYLRKYSSSRLRFSMNAGVNLPAVWWVGVLEV